ncbi:MAG: hypothetical protein ABT940_11690 [Alphaproteobacteria bacterium]
MSNATVHADLQLHIASFAAQTPFELVADDQDQGGNRPVCVVFSELKTRVTEWGILHSVPPVVPLTVKVAPDPDGNVFVYPPGMAPYRGSALNGLKRIKLFCSQADAVGLQIFDGSATPSSGSKDVTVTVLGRRADPVTETLSWSGEVARKLRWHYDAPTVEVAYQTGFRDRAGNFVAAPRYDQTRGEFCASCEAFGALLVRYQPEYTLLQVEYGNGSAVASPEMFKAMQDAWRSGDVTTAEIPPVRVFVIAGGKAAECSFPREFWPKSDPGVSYSVVVAKDDSSEKKSEVWNRVGGETVTKEISSATDPNVFVKVEYDTTAIMQNAATGEIATFKLG